MAFGMHQAAVHFAEEGIARFHREPFEHGLCRDQPGRQQAVKIRLFLLNSDRISFRPSRILYTCNP
jgi:hypothetical protein